MNGEGDILGILGLYDDALGWGSQVLLIQSGGEYFLRARAMEDGGEWPQTSDFAINDSVHAVEVDWIAASADGADDGAFTLWIDGEQVAELSGLDNDTIVVVGQSPVSQKPYHLRRHRVIGDSCYQIHPTQ